MANRLKSIAWALWLVAALAVSLMTFPSAIPWMVAFWLGWHTWRIWRREAGYLPLAACVGILVVKQVAWIPELMVLAGVMVVVAGAAYGLRKSTTVRKQRIAWAGVLALWAGWSMMGWGWYRAAHCGHPVHLQGSRPVACLGDSLTAGIVGDGGYPRELGKRITLPVVDFSQPGVDIDMASRSLPALLKARPQVVIVELGGNDFVRGHSRKATRKKLEQIITACRGIGAEVVLMEVPRGLCIDSFYGLERELAREYDLELISDTAIRKLVLWSPLVPPGMWTAGPYLSDDGLHPNAHGNRLLADEVARALVRLYGDGMRNRAR